MTDKTDVLYGIAADAVKPIWNGFLGAVRKTLEQASENQVYNVLSKENTFTKALESVDDLVELLGLNISTEVLPKLTETWFAAGRTVSSVIPKSGLLKPYAFDTSRVASLSSNAGYRALFVQQITREQQRVITQIINRGFVEGLSKRKVAQLIRDSIGLTSNQEQWVWNYRKQLEQLDPDMFDRELRDRRSDRKLHRLIDNDGQLTVVEINKLVERYRQRLMQYRAQTIARTEALRAVRMGEYDALVDAYDNGAIDGRIRRFWVTCLDERVRKTHTQIPGMNPDGRAMDEPFQTPLGLLRYPLDPDGVAANVINCRCHLEYRMPNSNGDYVGRSSSRLSNNVKRLLGD